MRPSSAKMVRYTLQRGVISTLNSVSTARNQANSLAMGVIEIIHPIHNGDILIVIKHLGIFFKAGVQIANDRHATHHALAIKFQHQANGGMRGRMLRAEVQGPKIFICGKVAGVASGFSSRIAAPFSMVNAIITSSSEFLISTCGRTAMHGRRWFKNGYHSGKMGCLKCMRSEVCCHHGDGIGNGGLRQGWEGGE